jgi:hypothetical protein
LGVGRREERREIRRGSVGSRKWRSGHQQQYVTAAVTRTAKAATVVVVDTATNERIDRKQQCLCMYRACQQVRHELLVTDENN